MILIPLFVGQRARCCNRESTLRGDWISSGRCCAKVSAMGERHSLRYRCPFQSGCESAGGASEV